MTHAKELCGKLLFSSILIVINGFSMVDDFQNGLHAEKVAYVGQYFKAVIDFGSGSLCNLSRIQISEVSSHVQPSWLMVNLTSKVLYGIPQENEVGSMIILITSFEINAESQELVCSTLAWKVTVELDTSSLASALNQYIDNRTDENNVDKNLLKCLSHPSIILASLNVGLGLSHSVAKLADVVADALNVSTEVMQVVDSSSSISFYKQLKSLRILQYENVVEAKLNDRTYYISWPLGCKNNHVVSLHIHKLYKRSLSGVKDMTLHGWHLTSGLINGEVHARRRRAVYFGSITALDGTPLQTSILSTNILSSAVFTSISNAANGTVSFSNASAFSTSTLSTLKSDVQTFSSSALSSLPTTMLNSFILSAVSQPSGDITNSFSNTGTILPSNVSRQSVSNNFPLSIEPDSSHSFLLKSTSPPTIVDKSSFGFLFSLYPSTLSKSFSNTSLPYILSFTTAPSKLSAQSANIASTAPIIIDNTTMSIRASSSQISAHFPTETPSGISTQYTRGASISRPAPSFTVVDSLYSSYFPMTSSFSLRYQHSSNEILNISSAIQSSIPPSFSLPRNSSDAISQSVAIPSTPLFPFISTISGESLSSIVPAESSQYIVMSSFSIPYQQNSTGIPIVASIAPSSGMDTFTSFRKTTSNVSSEAKPMSSTLILPSGTIADVSVSSRYSATPSLSIQLNVTEISNTASITPSSATTTFNSSEKAASNISSEAKTMRSRMITDEAVSSRYSATPPFSTQYQLNSTAEAISTLPSLIMASFASSRRDTSNMATQTIPAQSTSHFPVISIVNTSAYLQRSDFSTQAATGLSLTAPLTAVASTWIPKLTNVVSSYSFASSYSSIQLQGDNSSLSSIGEPVLSSQLLLDLSTTRPSTIVISQSEFNTIATDTFISKISHITSKYLSSLVLPSETATASTVLKSVSQLFSKIRTTSAIGAVSSTFGYTTSLATAFGQFESATTTLKSSVAGFSSGYTFVSATSYIKMNQSFTLASHFTNLALVSYSTMSLSGTSTVAATPILNTNPMLVNSIGRISAFVGRLLMFKIPFDTFYDRESGYTPNLSVSCRLASGQNLEKSFWVSYDNKSQTLSGLPLVDEYNRQGSEGARLEVVARDPSGGIARDVFNVYIENTAVDIQFALTARFSRQFQEFQTDRSLRVTLLSRIIRFYNTSTTSSYYVSSITNGSVLFSWSDTTVSGSTCNASAITKIDNYVRISSGSVTSGFAQAMLPDFPVLGVTFNYLGACLVVPTTPSVPVGPAAGERSVDIFTRYAVPTIAVAMVLALIVGALIFLSKRRRNKPPFLEKRTFRKGRPVLLPEEYELDGIRDPVISLPEDYVFSYTEDGSSVYSRPLSDIWDEDGKSYMDNPVYGLSKFQKPPPIYKKEIDFDGDYDSPYERPPPLYQMPPFYQDEDFMTSEV